MAFFGAHEEIGASLHWAEQVDDAFLSHLNTEEICLTLRLF